MIAPFLSALFVVASLFEGQAPKHARPTAVPSPSVTASAPAAESQPSPEPSQPPELPAETAAPNATASPAKKAAPARGEDRSADSKEPHLDTLLGDKWTCATFAGTKLEHRFTESEDGRQIVVATKVPLPHGHTVRLTERYTFDARASMWSANIANGALTASAPQWTGKTWRFSGSSVTNGAAQKVRMTFEPAGSNGFRREFSHLDRGRWSTYSGETCRRSLQI